MNKPGQTLRLRMQKYKVTGQELSILDYQRCNEARSSKIEDRTGDALMDNAFWRSNSFTQYVAHA